MNNVSDDINYILRTDGSGHTDGFGGWSAACICESGWSKTGWGAATETSVARMEFTGLLEGLTLIREHSRSLYRGARIRVKWFSDREDLVKSVRGEYGRHKNQDLWVRLAYFETLMEIEAIHVPRENKEHEQVDLLASTGREMIKQYCTGE